MHGERGSMRRRPVRWAGWLVAALVAFVDLAGGGPAVAAGPLRLTDHSFMDVDAQLKGAEGHPNEQWRWNGLKSYLSGRYPEAIERFERAAGYADKYAQHYLSLIYWYGSGVPRDPVRAYIWSDLAAERGSRRLLAIREKMWAGLTTDQRLQAAAGGPGYYDRYGDDVARPRADAEIRRFATNMTGSRIGFNNKPLAISSGGPTNGAFGNATAGMLAASGVAKGGSGDQRMYGDERTGLDAYWKAQDRQLDAARGSVDVGPPEKMEAGNPPR